MTLVAVPSVSFSRSEQLVARLRHLFPQARINYQGHKLGNRQLIKFLENVRGAIIGNEILDEPVLSQLPELKVVAKYGVGLDNIDFELLKRFNIRFYSKGGVNRRAVSELTLGGMIGLSRNIFFSGMKLKSGEWLKDGGCELTGRTVGIIGCGYIGEDILRLLQPFQCNLLINDIVDKSNEARIYGARQVDLTELLGRSDFVSLHVPLTELTHHLIGPGQLQIMKSNAVLINTSRGAVVNQNALKEALTTGQIRGAFLDVFEQEPPDDLEFLSLPNLMVCPHIGGNSIEAVDSMGTAALEGLVKGLCDVDGPDRILI